MQGLAGKAALVTGGANGIGLAICRRLAAAGCRVVILDRDAAAASAAVACLKRLRADARAIAADVTDHAALRSGIEATGRDIDILVNNAGWDRFMPFVETTPELWSKVLAVNLVGALNAVHAVLSGMIARGRGRIVNVASDSGRAGASGEVSYSAAKGGVIAMTKALAREVAAQGITANVVCPGPVETDLLRKVAEDSGTPEKLLAALVRAIPMRRLGKPEDVAGLVAFLASDEAAYITGQVVSVSGGLTMHG